MMIGSVFRRPNIARHKWKWIAALLVTGAAGWWLWSTARREGFHWRAFLDALAGLQWHWLLAAALCANSTYWVRALRWAVLIRPVRQHPRLANLFTATVIGFTAVTIFGRAGEFVRPYLISVKERVPFS